MNQSRSTQRRGHVVPSDEKELIKEICLLVGKYKKYGYRRITALLKKTGWDINHKRVERIWRKLGFNAVKRKQKRRRQLTVMALFVVILPLIKIMCGVMILFLTELQMVRS